MALDEASGAIAPRSVFFIYGEDGQASEELNDDFYEAADDPKQLWEVPDAGHVGGLRAEPAEYERRVVSFLERALDADRRRATDRSACVSP